MEKQKTEGIQLPNGWESVSEIGKGSFGVVYKAKRVIGRNTEWAAVKHISMPADPDDLNQIRAELGTANEATINAYLYESLQDMLGEYFQMKSLQGNTNIVACHDIQQIPKADGIGYDVFIWMELLDSLSKRTIDEKMNREEVVRMGLDICQALSLLRSKGIVHRDIKPQNIFVNERGDYKLGDFGSARGIKGTSTILTMKGTFSYMAPEIMQGRPANFTSDIYSLGLVMYRLLNRNRHPFMQEGEVSSARVIEESNYRRLGGEALPIPVNADEELGRIILKACSFEPRNRWQTPEEMYSALANLEEKTINKSSVFVPSAYVPSKTEAKINPIATSSALQEPTVDLYTSVQEGPTEQKVEQKMNRESTHVVAVSGSQTAIDFKALKDTQSGSSASIETASVSDRDNIKSGKDNQNNIEKKSYLFWMLLGAVIVIGIVYGVLKHEWSPSDSNYTTDNTQANETTLPTSTLAPSATPTPTPAHTMVPTPKPMLSTEPADEPTDEPADEPADTATPEIITGVISTAYYANTNDASSAMAQLQSSCEQQKNAEGWISYRITSPELITWHLQEEGEEYIAYANNVGGYNINVTTLENGVVIVTYDVDVWYIEAYFDYYEQ